MKTVDEVRRELRLRHHKLERELAALEDSDLDDAAVERMAELQERIEEIEDIIKGRMP